MSTTATRPASAARLARRDAIAIAIYSAMLSRDNSDLGAKLPEQDRAAAALAVDRAGLLLLELEQNGVPEVGE